MSSKTFRSLLRRFLGGRPAGDASRHIALLERGLSEDPDEEERYRIAETLCGAVYPRYKFSEFGRLFLEDEAFIEYYRRFMDPGNWHSLDRKYTLNELLKGALRTGGDAAECGVYRGASSYLVCRAIAGSQRINHLFDSFEGLSQPGEFDGAYWSPGALAATEEDVRAGLAEFDNFRLYPGWIPDRFEEVADRRFCFVHIDVDLYQPTRDSLEFFFPRLNKGGIVLMDDVGFKSCPGATRAAEEYFDNRDEPVIYLPTGQAFAIRE